MQVADEVLLDAPKVDGRGLLNRLAASRSHGDEGAPAVVFAWDSLHQPGSAHPVHEAGEAGAAEENEAGKVMHAEAVAIRLGELDEYVVPGKWQRALPHQLSLQHIEDAGVGSEERSPGCDGSRQRLTGRQYREGLTRHDAGPRSDQALPDILAENRCGGNGSRI
jgi:hypothetical protein